MSTAALRRQIKNAIDRVPPERLASLADYAHFLTQPSVEKRLAAEKAVGGGKESSRRKFRKLKIETVSA